ncbi:MAG: heme o synthase [Rhodobacteraceae bacterium]|nr:heme o synthase [Paracoccaceae bacterium]
MSDVNAASKGRDAEFGDYFALLKPRVMSLVIFTAAVGLFVAPGVVHPLIAFASILFIAIGAGASGALNMWWDADIDEIMKRTANRPVPSGRVTAEDAKMLGLWLSALAVMMLALTANFIAAGLLAFTIFFYAVIYTMWLKRSTPQNIVIGGAAGAFPPMIGWAVATGGISVESILMFALIFIWTPPHFWALALFMNDDYSKAGVPMLPVTHGTRETRKQILIYTLLLLPVGPLLAFSSIGGPVFLGVTIVLNLLFLAGALRLYRRNDAAATGDKFAAERKFFRLSLIYLFVHFVALLAEAVLTRASLSLAGWPVWVG